MQQTIMFYKKNLNKEYKNIYEAIEDYQNGLDKDNAICFVYTQFEPLFNKMKYKYRYIEVIDFLDIIQKSILMSLDKYDNKERRINYTSFLTSMIDMWSNQYTYLTNMEKRKINKLEKLDISKTYNVFDNNWDNGFLLAEYSILKDKITKLLNDVEIKILDCLMVGLSGRKIIKNLNISRHEFDKNLNNIKEKLQWVKSEVGEYQN